MRFVAPFLFFLAFLLFRLTLDPFLLLSFLALCFLLRPQAILLDFDDCVNALPELFVSLLPLCPQLILLSLLLQVHGCELCLDLLQLLLVERGLAFLVLRTPLAPNLLLLDRLLGMFLPGDTLSCQLRCAGAEIQKLVHVRRLPAVSPSPTPHMDPRGLGVDERQQVYLPSTIVQQGFSDAVLSCTTRLCHVH